MSVWRNTYGGCLLILAFSTQKGQVSLLCAVKGGAQNENIRRRPHVDVAFAHISLLVSKPEAGSNLPFPSISLAITSVPSTPQCEFKTACTSGVKLRGAATMDPRAKTTAG
jgi:hypothetical protein